MEEGQKIPAFELPDQDGTRRTVADLAGQKGLILYAYPKDDTPGCTLEAQDFRDLEPELRQLGYQVAGISQDPADSHCRFIDKYGLTFPLLTDERATFLEAIGAFGEITLFGRKTKGVLRTTVVVDPEGWVIKAYPGVNAQGHAAQVLADLEEA